MTDRITDFIKTYGRQGDETAFLNPDFKEELLNVQEKLESLEPHKREEVVHILKGILKDIDKQVDTLSVQASELTAQLQANQDSMKACVAYLKNASGGERK